MANTLVNQIQSRRLVLTAEELRQLTGWPDQVIEDYLAAIETILSIAETTDNSGIDISILEADSNISPISKRASEQEDYSRKQREKDLDHFTSLMPSRINRVKVGELMFTDIKTDGLVTNTNTPGGATAYQLAVKDETGSIVGYIPLYGSAW